LAKRKRAALSGVARFKFKGLVWPSEFYPVEWGGDPHRQLSKE